jgi:CelD/BcsL family acetyltransferase involved in cellulose biosynthesis
MAASGGSSHWAISMNVELVQSEHRWDDLRDEWDLLLSESVFPSIFLSFDYLATAFNTFHARSSEPFILVMRDADGVLIGIAPFRRSQRRRWGIPQAVLEYLVTWEIDKPYVIARNGYEDLVWNTIFNFLDTNPAEWDLLDLIEMPDFLRGAVAVEQFFKLPSYRCQKSTGPDGSYVDLTQSWEQFLCKHKNYRKALNQLAQRWPDFTVVTFDAPGNIREGLECYVALERLGPKHGQVGVEKNQLHIDFYQTILPKLAAKHCVYIHILVNDEGHQIAGKICYSFGQVLYGHHTVYDPDFSKYSPGKSLMGLMLREHMGDHELKTADLLCGFADYYKPWAAQIVTTKNIEVLRMSAGARFLLAGQWIKGLIRNASRTTK